MTLKEAANQFLVRQCTDSPLQNNLTAEQKKNMKRFDVFRYDSGNSQLGKLVSYYIDINKCGPMYLDALIKIKDEIDSTLSFRRSCREGICGSCAMSIDGRHHLACISSYQRNLEPSLIYPLEFCGVIKDLVVDMTNFYNQYKLIEPYLKKKTEKAPGQKEYLQSQEDRALIDGLYECVLCNSCSTSCPSYWWHSTLYLGPSVLMQAYRWVIDSRDDYREERLRMLGGDMRMDECKQLGVCTLNCPKDLDPRTAIGHLKHMYEDYKVHHHSNMFGVAEDAHATKEVEEIVEDYDKKLKKIFPERIPHHLPPMKDSH